MEEQIKRLLLVLFIVLVTGFKCFAPDINQLTLSVTEINKPIIQKNTLLRKEEAFSQFLTDLGANESSNNWKIYNKYGYIGEWQLGKAALKDVGYKHILFNDFKKNPYIFPRYHQVIAVKRLINLNQKRLEPYFEKYIGDTIKGVEITKSGLLAGAHLGGSGGVKRFLDSNGRIDRKDALGTTISRYIEEFKNYNL